MYTRGEEAAVTELLSSRIHDAVEYARYCVEIGRMDVIEADLAGGNLDLALLDLEGGNKGEEKVIWGTYSGYSAAYTRDVLVRFPGGEESEDIFLNGTKLDRDKWYTFRAYVNPDLPAEDEVKLLVQSGRLVYELRYACIGGLLGSFFLCLLCLIFLLCGAGAAGPALEGGVVRTGMRAVKGAVDRVRIENGEIHSHVLGEGKAEGICGSGIVDLLAELFKNGWIDLRGKLEPEKSPLIERQGGTLAVEYAPGLFFFQEDIDEFLRTKAAAYTMVEYMLIESGVSLDEILKVYVSGAFGKHVSKESAVTIGMYPDIDRTRLISPGNTSLDGAVEVLLDKSILDEIDEILDKMVYIQFGAVEDFLQMMTAALALPHTDLEKFPSVTEMLARRRQMDMEEGD